jgi:hypothetical protein
MGVKRSSGTARLEEMLVLEWRRYAGRRVRPVERVASGTCYLEPRPCPFEARPDFETRFTQDCVHCARLQGAIERSGTAGASPRFPRPRMKKGATAPPRSSSARSRSSTPRRIRTAPLASSWPRSPGRTAR